MRASRLVCLIPMVVAACEQDAASIGGEYQLVLDQPPEPIAALDVLFVIDDSGSMLEEHEALIAAASESLFSQLALDAGGLPDLHVAFVSTDLGAGSGNIANCDSSNEGVFQLGAVGGPGCPDIDGRFLVDEDDGQGGRARNFTTTIGEAFACAAAFGIDGCGFEQPLEAMRRALDGSNPENAGFLRDDALLLVVFLTDEDDCSVFDDGLFDTSAEAMETLGNLSSFRCFEHGVVCDDDQPRELGVKTSCTPREDSAYVHPMGRYVDFLHGLKSDPSMVMVAGMFGDPHVEVTEDVVPSWEILADVCPGDTRADPAVRLHALTGGFPARWVFTTICDPMAKRLTTIADTTANVLAARACLTGALPPSPMCHAFAAVPGGARRTLPMCTAEVSTACVAIARDEQACAFTSHALAATAPGLLEPGEHLLVECGVVAP